MSKKKNQPDKQKPQPFIKIVRELECDEDEDRFNEMLKRIVPKEPVAED